MMKIQFLAKTAVWESKKGSRIKVVEGMNNILAGKEKKNPSWDPRIIICITNYIS